MEAIGYNNLWRAIIRPPRAEYDMDDLGPSKFLVRSNEGEQYKV